MPDFTVRIASGATPTIWEDFLRPPNFRGAHDPAGAVSRINPRPIHPHKYQRATVGTQVEARVTFEGVEAPMDADLAVPFSSDFGEYPGVAPLISSPAGQSSVQRFTPRVVGHHLWVFRHEGGGALGLHLDVEADFTATITSGATPFGSPYGPGTYWGGELLSPGPPPVFSPAVGTELQVAVTGPGGAYAGQAQLLVNGVPSGAPVGMSPDLRFTPAVANAFYRLTISRGAGNSVSLLVGTWPR